MNAENCTTSTEKPLLGKIRQETQPGFFLEQINKIIILFFIYNTNIYYPYILIVHP